MRIISLINQKGGVGKTTCVINIGDALIKLKRSVLLIDLDPQAHLTYSLGIKAHELNKTIYNVLREEVKIEDIKIERKKGLDIIPSTLDLTGSEIELSSIAGREMLLKEALEPIGQRYNYILIDCPPSLGLLTLNALVCTKEVFIPLQTEYLALQGMSKLLETIEVVKKRLNKELNITGIIGTRYDNRKILNKEIIEKIKEHFSNKLFKTLIRENISIAEAPSYGHTIFEYKPDSHGAEDYLNLAKEIINQEV